MKKRSSRDPNPNDCRPNRLRVTVPERVSPHVKLVFSEMQRQGVIYDDLAWKSGVQRAAIKGWRTKNTPMLTSLEAVLGALGWDFVPVPRGEQLPPEAAAKLRAVADELGRSMPATMGLVAQIVGDARRPAAGNGAAAAALPPPGEYVLPLDGGYVLPRAGGYTLSGLAAEREAGLDHPENHHGER